MTYYWLLAAHLSGAALLGAAIVATWFVERRIRRARDCGTIKRAGRLAGALAQRVVMPGVVLLAVSGIWLVARHYGGWNFARIPWLAGMAAIFLFQSAWANLVTRPHAQRMGRLLAGTGDADPPSPALQRARSEPLARAGQALEPLLFALAVALGVLRPMDWAVVAIGGLAAALVAVAIALYPAPPPALSSFSKPSVEAEGGS